MAGLFITGTDTCVGKTVLAAAIVAALRAHGVAVRALKPVITGLDELPDRGWPHDHELLARAAGSAAEEVTVVRYGPAVSPHLAAELAGDRLDREQLRSAVSDAVSGSDVAIVEGVGGLKVPLCDGYDVLDLARDLRLPVVIAARPGLGTINHTLLTLEAARRGGLEVIAIVMTPWPADPGALERSNRATIERLGGVRVATLPPVARAEPQLLAAAGTSLPLERWVRFRPTR